MQTPVKSYRLRPDVAQWIAEHARAQNVSQARIIEQLVDYVSERVSADPDRAAD